MASTSGNKQRVLRISFRFANRDDFARRGRPVERPPLFQVRLCHMIMFVAQITERVSICLLQCNYIKEM
jgi:hypothetical protein